MNVSENNIPYHHKYIQVCLQTPAYWVDYYRFNKSAWSPFDTSLYKKCPHPKHSEPRHARKQHLEFQIPNSLSCFVQHERSALCCFEWIDSTKSTKSSSSSRYHKCIDPSPPTGQTKVRGKHLCDGWWICQRCSPRTSSKLLYFLVSILLIW